LSTENEDRNAQLVLAAFDALFNRRDFAAAASYWSPNYLQHSAVVPAGRDGLFNHVAGFPTTVRYEHHVIAANGDYVLVHGRFSGEGLPTAIVMANIVRIEDGQLAEHWEVLQNEVTRAESKSGLPMFGDAFPPDSPTTPTVLCSPSEG
jgi:predicted SnoaL-like aldol condensation-catalyzing enzyme